MIDSSRLNNWRKETRRQLIARRRGLTIEQRRTATRRIARLIHSHFGILSRLCTAWYWPYGGEPDLRYLARYYRLMGALPTLPVVIDKDSPVEFWLWHPSIAMTAGFAGIPVPAERVPLKPSVLIVPLLGFDAQGYRLGYGSGFYDRTLSVVRPTPFTIGVGYESCRLPSIYPLPHDIPMDAIVTESGVRWLRYRGRPYRKRLKLPVSRAPADNRMTGHQAAPAAE